MTHFLSRQLTTTSFLILTSLCGILGCSIGSENESRSESAKVARKSKCKSVELKKVSETLLDLKDPCRDLVSKVYGRVLGAAMGGSAGIVRTKTKAGTALIVTALHVLKPSNNNYKGNDEVDLEAQLEAPLSSFASYPLFQAFMVGQTGASRDSKYNPTYPMFFKSLPFKTWFTDAYKSIAPKDDFVVAAMGGGKYFENQLPKLDAPTPVTDINDPQFIGASDTPYTSAIAGELAIVMGYPGSLGGEMGYSVGLILTESEATERWNSIDQEEKAIELDYKAEFFVGARAGVGMSGGPTFNMKGEYLGVNSRASMLEGSQKNYTRITRATYIFDDALKAAKSKIAKTEAEKLLPYLK